MWRFVWCGLVLWTMCVNGGTIEVKEAERPDLMAPWASKGPVGDGFHQTKIEGEEPIVRNFFPLKGKQKWMRREFPPVTEMIFFNISAIGDNEEVTLAQLHLHRRRLTKSHVNYHKRFLPVPYRVVLYQIQPDYRYKSHEDARTMKLASIPVSHATRGGWHTLDVTAVVRELLINAQGPLELLFGVHFEAPKKIEKTYTPLVPLKHFLKNPGSPTSDHPFKTSSYLVIFSETDPYFEEFDEDTTSTTTKATQTLTSEFFKERHFKHKIFKEKEDGNDVNDLNFAKKLSSKELKDKSTWKYKKIENEVYKEKKNDVLRHKGKHRVIDVKRSKADEKALLEKTKLKSLPFLHANEVEEIRQTSRRLTRSFPPREASSPQDPN